MPKATVDDNIKLARLSSDCSLLLTHMVRQNTEPERTDEAALQILKSILAISGASNKPLLKSSPIGWYNSCDAKVHNPLSGDFERPDNLEAVCFTESTLSGLKAHRDIFKVKYGVGFGRKFLLDRGANPCLNINDDIFKDGPVSLKNKKGYSREYRLFNFIPKKLTPYINIISPNYDSTHEREWRYCGDFEFKIENLIFIFCPFNDFKLFSKVQNNGLPVLFDLGWLDNI